MILRVIVFVNLASRKGARDNQRDNGERKDCH